MRRLPHGSRVLAGPDPATLAPRGTPVYVEAIVRPQGAMASGVLAVGTKRDGERTLVRIVAALD